MNGYEPVVSGYVIGRPEIVAARSQPQPLGNWTRLGAWSEEKCEEFVSSICHVLTLASRTGASDATEHDLCNNLFDDLCPEEHNIKNMD
jgi:hypothetical protein